MGRIVADNSVVMAWFFEDEWSPYAEAVLDATSDFPVVVPSVWPLEVGNTFLMAERRKRIRREQWLRFIADLDAMPIAVERESTSRMLTEILLLASEHQLTTYDASYLDLAMRKNLPLATLDKALRRAAGKCGVDHYSP